MWRYFSIVDRRLRTRTWTPLDLAATNALFWTERGWNGGEQMITRSLPYCNYIPDRSTAEILSGETFKSIVAVIQGIQAAYSIIAPYTRGIKAFSTSLAADQIFFPLSLLGLLRLFATPWLSQDYKYTSRVDFGVRSGYRIDKPHGACENRLSLDSLIDFPAVAASYRDHYRKISCWQSRLFRTIFLAILLGIWFVSFLWIYPFPTGSISQEFTISALIATVTYFFLVTVSVAVHAFYFVQGRTTSTILPCANHLWYKIYTVVLFVSMTVMLVFSLWETSKTVCGTYTSVPVALADEFGCWTPMEDVWPVDSESNDSDVIGLAVRYPHAAKGIVLKEGDFWLRNFSGTCLGHWLGNLRVHASPLDVANFTGLNDWNNGTVTECDGKCLDL
ncbi:hypothetical protein F4808DRAFT_473215 [Astrocystis sublimbata]|nr:hypothetical protein F4808DRAFT_473215 [Astrocystis sublimbata]